MALGLAVPGLLSLITLPAVHALLPPALDPAVSADERLFLLFFGLASLPFTLAACGVAWLRPARSRRLRWLAWAGVALAAGGAAYAFTGALAARADAGVVPGSGEPPAPRR